MWIQNVNWSSAYSFHFKFSRSQEYFGYKFVRKIELEAFREVEIWLLIFYFLILSSAIATIHIWLRPQSKQFQQNDLFKIKFTASNQ